MTSLCQMYTTHKSIQTAPKRNYNLYMAIIIGNSLFLVVFLSFCVKKYFLDKKKKCHTHAPT